MKKSLSILFVLALQIASVNFLFAGANNDTTKIKTTEFQKSCFYSAKQEIEDMLSGKQPLNYERAVFLTENAWYENKLPYIGYTKMLDYYSKIIASLTKLNNNINKQDFKPTLLKSAEFQKEEYNKALSNWAIHHFIADSTYLSYENSSMTFYPMNYSYADPFATSDWRNSQVVNILRWKENGGNCYALASLFKILSLRFNSDANIVTVPNHIYIEHKDNKGIKYNVELASKAFPGFGSLQTLTYTTDEAIKSGIAFRTLDLKQSIILSLVYLAKGYENKFGIKDDEFILSCADLALKNDSLNLNAMLLKAEVLEARIINKKKSILQLQVDNGFQQYQNFIAKLYQLGYREMPLEMKNILVSTMRKDTVPLILKDHTPQPFASIGVKTTRYATLSNGLFEEVHTTKPTEKFNHTVFDTKTKKIKTFENLDALYNNYNFDPVVFALSIDPLTHKYPSFSPYVFCYNNPINVVDVDGREGIVVSGSPGGHDNKQHFLINGLQRAKDAKKHTQRKDEVVTWIIYNDPTPGAGQDPKLLAKYQAKAAKLGINVIVVTDADKIVDYVNEKTGGDSRTSDPITSFYYTGHAVPGDLSVGYGGTGANFEPDDFNSEAFSSGCYVNLVGGCRTAIPGVFEDSNVTQFQEILDDKSTIKGSDVRVGYLGGERTDKQLTNYTDENGKKVEGNVVEKKGDLSPKK